MNVDPVQASAAGIERQTPEKKVPVAPSPLGAASGDAPKREITETQYTPAPSVIPEHEVKLQLNTSSDTVVYQLLDKQSGALGSASAQRPADPRHSADSRTAATNCCQGQSFPLNGAWGPVVKGEEKRNGDQL